MRKKRREGQRERDIGEMEREKENRETCDEGIVNDASRTVLPHETVLS